VHEVGIVNARIYEFKLKLSHPEGGGLRQEVQALPRTLRVISS